MYLWGYSIFSVDVPSNFGTHTLYQFFIKSLPFLTLNGKQMYCKIKT